MFPATALYVHAGTQLAQIDEVADVLSFEVWTAFLALAILPWCARASLQWFKTMRLYQNVRRPKKFDFDVLVIGGGSAGLVAANLAAQLRAKVGLVEKKRMGGDCLYTGCVPSKALIHSARVAHSVRQAQKFGLHAQLQPVDLGQVMQHVQQAIRTIAPHDSPERYSALGVTCIAGEAVIEDPFHVRIDGQRYSFRNLILATGAGPKRPLIPGLADVPHVTSDELWSLTKLPQRLLVLGGGPIGCELAQSFARLGSEVHVVEQGPQLLPKEDADIADKVAEVLRAEHVQLHLQSQLQSMQKSTDGQAQVVLRDGNTLLVDMVIVAVGREPRSSGFGLEKLQLEKRANGTLVTDVYMRTRWPHIFACGDVTGPYQLTHAASHQASCATLNALFSPFKKFACDLSSVPWCTFVDPEVARVGLNEKEATQQNIPYSVYKHDLVGLDRAVCEGENFGMVKVLVRPGTDQLLGACVVGPQAGETLSELVLAQRLGLGLDAILHTVHSYPTRTEANRFVAGTRKKQTAPAWALNALGRLHTWRRG